MDVHGNRKAPTGVRSSEDTVPFRKRGNQRGRRPVCRKDIRSDDRPVLLSNELCTPAGGQGNCEAKKQTGDNGEGSEQPLRTRPINRTPVGQTLRGKAPIARPVG
jgi:hypothetical protein